MPHKGYSRAPTKRAAYRTKAASNKKYKTITAERANRKSSKRQGKGRKQ